MREETFTTFWNMWSTSWLHSDIVIEKRNVPVSELCRIKENYGQVLYKRYELIKEIVKDSYFQNTSNKLSRYKRAAVVAYTINGASPLIYEDKSVVNDMEPIFLKQRLAFHVALGSIIQDYSKDEVKKLEKPLFYFDDLGKRDVLNKEDNFLQSVYKDLFYAEVYDNYNVLTMANVFGLLVERASKLSDLIPFENIDQTNIN